MQGEGKNLPREKLRKIALFTMQEHKKTKKFPLDHLDTQETATGRIVRTSRCFDPTEKGFLARLCTKLEIKSFEKSC